MDTDQPTPQPSSDPTAPPETSGSAEVTQSIEQYTSPTQALPMWEPPYPTAPLTTAGPGAATGAPAFPAAPAGPSSSGGPSLPPPPPPAPQAAWPPPQGAAGRPPTGPAQYHPPVPTGAAAQYGATYGTQYGPPPYAPAPYASPQIPPVGHGSPQRTNTSGLVLTIISGLLVFSCYFALIGLPSFIIGIVAMTRQNTEWESSRRLARIGWWVLGAMVVLAVATVAAIIAFAPSDDGPSSY